RSRVASGRSSRDRDRGPAWSSSPRSGRAGTEFDGRGVIRSVSDIAALDGVARLPGVDRTLQRLDRGDRVPVDGRDHVARLEPGGGRGGPAADLGDLRAEEAALRLAEPAAEVGVLDGPAGDELRDDRLDGVRRDGEPDAVAP